MTSASIGDDGKKATIIIVTTIIIIHYEDKQSLTPRTPQVTSVQYLLGISFARLGGSPRCGVSSGLADGH